MSRPVYVIHQQALVMERERMRRPLTEELSPTIVIAARIERRRLRDGDGGAGEKKERKTEAKVVG